MDTSELDMLQRFRICFTGVSPTEFYIELGNGGLTYGKQAGAHMRYGPHSLSYTREKALFSHLSYTSVSYGVIFLESFTKFYLVFATCYHIPPSFASFSLIFATFYQVFPGFH